MESTDSRMYINKLLRVLLYILRTKVAFDRLFVCPSRVPVPVDRFLRNLTYTRFSGTANVLPVCISFSCGHSARRSRDKKRAHYLYTKLRFITTIRCHGDTLSARSRNYHFKLSETFAKNGAVDGIESHKNGDISCVT